MSIMNRSTLASKSCGIVTLSRSRLVKFLVYGVIYILFSTEMVLEWVFGMSISPNVLVLMAETNTRESAEFFGSLLDKPQLWQAASCVAGMLITNIVVELMRPRINQWVRRWLSKP